MARIGLYSGSFDPITNGHVDIIRRALRMVDHLIIGVGVHASKTPMLTLEERLKLIEAEGEPLAREAGGKVSTMTFSGLVVDAADEVGATLIVRGLRSAGDFEYEAQMAGMNGTMNPRVETVFLAASPSVQFISSTLVRQIASMGGDISPFVPKSVETAIAAKLSRKN